MVDSWKILLERRDGKEIGLVFDGMCMVECVKHLKWTSHLLFVSPSLIDCRSVSLLLLMLPACQSQLLKTL